MAKKKAKKPSYADSTYLKQISYYRKLAADYNADDTRKRAEVGSYYGSVGTADKKTAVKDKKGKQVYDSKSTGFKYVNVKKKVNGKWRTVKVPKTQYKKTARTKTTKGKAATEGVYQKELRDQRSKDTVDIADDYAARGMIHSGLYAQKRGDYEKEFGKQMAEQNRQKSKQYGDLASSRTSFNRQQELEREQAKQDAIRRRAQKAGNFLA